MLPIWIHADNNLNILSSRIQILSDNGSKFVEVEVDAVPSDLQSWSRGICRERSCIRRTQEGYASRVQGCCREVLNVWRSWRISNRYSDAVKELYRSNGAEGLPVQSGLSENQLFSLVISTSFSNIGYGTWNLLLNSLPPLLSEGSLNWGSVRILPHVLSIYFGLLSDALCWNTFNLGEGFLRCFG